MIKGVFATDQGVQASRIRDYASGLIQIHPTGTAQMLALSAGLKRESARDVIITWFERTHDNGRIGVTNNAGTGTSLTVSTTDASKVLPNHLYLAEATGEYILVSSVAGGTITVQRGIGPVAAAALDGSGTTKYLQRISNAHEEGSAKPTAVAQIGAPVFNYTQIFRNAWDVTGTATAVQWHTGDQVADNQAQASLFHSEDIERSILWGVRATGIQNGKPWRMFNGLKAQLTTNVTTQTANGGDTRWTDINNWLEGVFEKNIKGQPNERVFTTGNKVLKVLNDIARLEGHHNLSPGDTDFGLKVMQWYTPFGDMPLMTHPLMVESSAHFSKDLIAWHPASFKLRWLRPTFMDNYDANGTRAGADADFGVVTSELSLEYNGEQTGGYFSGIDTAAAEA